MMTGLSTKGTPICCLVIEPKMGVKILVVLEILSLLSLVFLLIGTCFDLNYVVCEKSNLVEEHSFLKLIGPLVYTRGNNIKALYTED